MNDDKQTINEKPDNQQSAGKLKLPYFDFLLDLLKEGNEAVEKSFGKHVHWGYWEYPKLASLTADDFEHAAEALSEQVCVAGNIHNGLKVLDVGCGFGGTIAHINERFVRMELVGLNIDERQLQRARETIIPTDHNHIDFQQGNACALPFPDQSFGVVLAVECIFHFPDRKQFFKEAHRVLKPGGYLALSDFVASPQLLPFTKIKLPAWGFYGKCNLQCTSKHYQALAGQTQFSIQVERNITANTLPTYTYLRQMARKQRITSKSAVFETLLVEGLSRLGLLHYYIYGFQK